MSRLLNRSLDRLKHGAESPLRAIAGLRKRPVEPPAPVAPPPRPSGVFHLSTPTHYGNLMIQYMVARRVAALCPGMAISNVHLPVWGIELPILAPRHDRCLTLPAEQNVPLARIEYLHRNRMFYRYEWWGWGQRMENFPERDLCRQMFQAEAQGFPVPDDCVACPIRGGEVLHAVHSGYPTVPIDFYSDMVERLGLTPVFFGQLEENSFVSALRKRFPQGQFLPKMSALDDFQTIRNARNIILPVSTFAWLAAWLSHAEQIILPVFGLFDPALYPLHDLLPVSESAYSFYQFPPEPAVPLAELAEVHARMKGQWREVEPLSLIADCA